ncbi:MAG TPA: hypothetical protein VFG12_00415 [Rhodopila sp.]|jgi:hypothetical protein|nr:hypothetical protein [Rhodopila sp.]
MKILLIAPVNRRSGQTPPSAPVRQAARPEPEKFMKRNLHYRNAFWHPSMALMKHRCRMATIALGRQAENSQTL